MAIAVFQPPSLKISALCRAGALAKEKDAMNLALRAFAIIFFMIVLRSPGDTLTLPQAQKLLFNNNRDVQIAETQYLKSLVAVSEAKASYYPTAETFAGYYYQSKPNMLDVETQIDGIIPKFGNAMGINNLTDVPIDLVLNEPVGDHDKVDWGVDISYPIFTGGARKNAVLAKQTASTIHCMELIAAKDRLSLQLGLMYFMWELSIERLEVQQAYIEQVSEYVVQMQNLFNAGVESKSKTLEASARLEAAKVDLLSAAGSVDSLRLELVDFLQLEDTSIVPQTYEYKLAAEVMDSRPRAYRPEVSAIDSTIKSIQYTEKMLFGQRFPTIFLSAGYRVGNPGIVMGGDEFIDWGVAGMQVRWTIYDGQKTWAQREQFRHDRLIMKREREKQLAMWDKTAAQQRLQIEKALRVKAAAELSLAAAEAFAEELKNAYAAGVASSSDYLNALASVAQAKFKVAQAQTICKSSSIRLAFALGESMEYK